jgi:hypothetical protein
VKSCISKQGDKRNKKGKQEKYQEKQSSLRKDQHLNARAWRSREARSSESSKPLEEIGILTTVLIATQAAI